MSDYTIYKQKDLAQYAEVIEKARSAWAQAARAEYEKTGDCGSCIVGDGIGVYAIPPRCRKPVFIMLIRSSSVASCQGSLHYEATSKIAEEMLKEAGLDVHYNCGRMD